MIKIERNKTIIAIILIINDIFLLTVKKQQDKETITKEINSIVTKLLLLFNIHFK